MGIFRHTFGANRLFSKAEFKIAVNKTVLIAHGYLVLEMIRASLEGEMTMAKAVAKKKAPAKKTAAKKPAVKKTVAKKKKAA